MKFEDELERVASQLNVPVERRRDPDWIIKNAPRLYAGSADLYRLLAFAQVVAEYSSVLPATNQHVIKEAVPERMQASGSKPQSLPEREAGHSRSIARHAHDRTFTREISPQESRAKLVAERMERAVKASLEQARLREKS